MDECVEPILLTVKQVSALMQISEREIWRMVKLGKFPPPRTIGLRIKRWYRGVINEFAQTGRWEGTV